MKQSLGFIFKASLLACALCAALVPGASAAPQWDYVYLSTASTPDTYPYGAWNQELYLVATDTITPVNSRLYFNLKDSLFFYGRGEQADPRISASNFTFEWRQEVISPGIQFSMEMSFTEDPNNGVIFIYQYDGIFLLFADGTVEMLFGSPATGQHTYRLVKSDSQVELYVDGALTTALPVGAYTVNNLELSGWGMEFAPYEAYWDHVSYTRGAYSPADLPSPTEVPVSTTACVEVTGVPNWKQFNDGINNWWGDIYDHTSHQIKKSGCALTAVAQAITKQGFNKNPAELNNLLKATNGGFVGEGYIDFEVVSTTASLNYIEENYSTVSQIQTQLETGNPVILRLWSLGIREDGTRPSHFVVAVGKCGDTIYINDPGHSSIYTNRPTLSQYFDELPAELRRIRTLLYYYQ